MALYFASPWQSSETPPKKDKHYRRGWFRAISDLVSPGDPARGEQALEVIRKAIAQDRSPSQAIEGEETISDAITRVYIDLLEDDDPIIRLWCIQQLFGVPCSVYLEGELIEALDHKDDGCPTSAGSR